MASLTLDHVRGSEPRRFLLPGPICSVQGCGGDEPGGLLSIWDCRCPVDHPLFVQDHRGEGLRRLVVDHTTDRIRRRDLHREAGRTAVRGRHGRASIDTGAGGVVAVDRLQLVAGLLGLVHRHRAGRSTGGKCEWEVRGPCPASGHLRVRAAEGDAGRAAAREGPAALRHCPCRRVGRRSGRYYLLDDGYRAEAATERQRTQGVAGRRVVARLVIVRVQRRTRDGAQVLAASCVVDAVPNADGEYLRGLGLDCIGREDAVLDFAESSSAAGPLACSVKCWVAVGDDHGHVERRGRLGDLVEAAIPVRASGVAARLGVAVDLVLDRRLRRLRWRLT